MLHHASLAIGAAVVVGFSFYFFYPDPSREAPTSTTTPLSPSHFTPAKVLMNEVSGPDTKLLELIVPPELLPQFDPSESPFAPIWSVYIKDDDIQVERPYTPLEGVDGDGRMLFWIKKYPKGEVGRWLHSKTRGETIELRGPLRTWPWREDEWDEVVMISGGTGITPFYQLFHSVISPSPEHRTRFTLLHSSRTPADIPPPRIMDKLSAFADENPERFRLGLFVDSREGPPHPSHLPTPSLGRIGKFAIEQCLGLNGRTSWWQRLFGESEKPKPLRKVLFLVCGPDPMISAIAGPFGRNLSQGAVGGVLGEMGFTSSEVYKL
ncbi:NADH-cytochrome b5 reductase 2 [Termitomyces sp. T112]|nr:NADH-cytochrome b5 reductase 2 [Termitomyces sp. T112]